MFFMNFHYAASFGDDFDAKNQVIQTYEMVFIKFWYIKHYGARVGDDFVTKNNKLERTKIWLFIVS